MPIVVAMIWNVLIAVVNKIVKGVASSLPWEALTSTQ